MGDHFGFFLPAAGKERYRAVEENPIDVKATGKLAWLYDALTKANSDWGSDARSHEMNQKFSVIQILKSVPRALTSDKTEVDLSALRSSAELCAFRS